MDIRIDFLNIRADIVGKKHGLSHESLDEFVPIVEKYIQEIRHGRESGELPYFDLPYQDAVAQSVLKMANNIAEEFENFIVLGIGGSALGGIALHRALGHPYYNLLSHEARQHHPRIFFLDNIDPDTIAGLSECIDLEKTCFNVISKSGTTAETNAQFLIFIHQLRQMKPTLNLPRHVIATTDAQKGTLRRIADQEGFRTLVIPDGVGGRFSVFSPVGLLPAAVAGIDIRQVLAGAAHMDTRCQSTQLWKNPAALNAVTHFLLDRKFGKTMSAAFTYSDALYKIVDWYCQLWAESLGKKYNLAGSEVFSGQTPIKALGTTDQHSQLQIYIEGPNNKVITLIGVDDFHHQLPIPIQYSEIPDIAYLSNHSLNELLQAEQRATAFTLTKNQRPNVTISLPKITPFTVGQLLFLFMVQTSVAGKLYQINPYDQPGVEEGKQFAYGILGRKGFEQKKNEIGSAPKPDIKYLL